MNDTIFDLKQKNFNIFLKSFSDDGNTEIGNCLSEKTKIRGKNFGFTYFFDDDSICFEYNFNKVELIDEQKELICNYAYFKMLNLIKERSDQIDNDREINRHHEEQINFLTKTTYTV